LSNYDLIVLGTGGVGSAAMYHAAQRGLRCLGLDRFPPAHDRGSSHGESRLIRLSYFEHPDYVPLLRRSYELWDALDPALLTRSGIFYSGPEDSEIISGVLASARQHDLRVDTVDPADFPQYAVPDGYVALLEPDAGWLPVETCVLTHLSQACAAGAEHRWGETVRGWQQDSDGVRVVTDQGEYAAGALVICGGAWSNQLIHDLEPPLTVTRKHLHWFECDDARYANGFFFELPHGQFYGFPAGAGRLKLAEHSGGEPISDPLNASREPDPEDASRIEDFVAQHLPGVADRRLEHASCFYTMTPDGDFIVDRYPGCANVAFAAGLSGHGFKLAPALGEVLVDLATGSDTPFDTRFIALGRFA
jgi:monomeric sarcosine oxidase